MSMGSRSLAYAPVTKKGVEIISQAYPNVDRALINKLYIALTDRLTTETLLFTAIISSVSRYLQQEDVHGNGKIRGAGFKLSALRKDKAGKMQSYVMELLHDVIVEMQMSGRTTRNVQNILSEYGMTMAFMHSCDEEIVATKDLDAWFESRAQEESLRTSLDWSGTLEKNVPVEEVLAKCEYTEAEAREAEKCYSVALQAVEASGIQTVVQKTIVH